MSGILVDVDASATRGLVVVGAGVAGLRVAQTVRREGYRGPLTIVGAEPHLPYDRPPLSKQVLMGEMAPVATCYHPSKYYADELGVELRLGRRASSLDPEAQRLELDDGDALDYAALVVATGARPRQLPFTVPTKGLLTLRTIDDAMDLRQELLNSTRLVVVGAGFVGAEVASTAAALGLDVVVVETAPMPLVRAVGEPVGARVASLHETAGVNLVCAKGVTGFLGQERLEGLTLDDGTVLDVELALVGVGVVPDIDWLDSTGLDMSDGLTCDEYLTTSIPTIFGAGDAISWPSSRLGRRARSQQWTTAGDQGRHVGQVLVRGHVATGPFDHDLYFWSDQYGARIQGFGDPAADPVIVTMPGDPERFVAAFREADRLTGAVGLNSPKEFTALRKLARRSAPWHEVQAVLSSCRPEMEMEMADG